MPSHWSPGQPIDNPDRVRRLYFQTNGSQRRFPFRSREGYVPDVRYLLVQKYDNSALFFTFEQLGSCSSTYSIPLDDHPEFFKRLAASPLQSSEAIIVLFAFGYNVAREQARYGFLDFLGVLSRLDLGFCGYEDFFGLRTTWSTRLVLLLRSSLLSSFSTVRSANAISFAIPTPSSRLSRSEKSGHPLGLSNLPLR